MKKLRNLKKETCEYQGQLKKRLLILFWQCASLSQPQLSKYVIKT